MKYLHIGMGKAGSTYLQKIFFRDVSKILKINFYKNFDWKKNLKQKKSFIISNEELVGEFLDIRTWEELSEENYKTFGNEVKVIIVIRRAIDYFASYYTQCYKMNSIIPEEIFFKGEKEIKKNPPKDKFFARYEKFDYENLINLYSSKFKNVYIIKYEDLNNLKIWSKVFNNKILLNYNYKKIYFNKSYSSIAMKFTYFLENILKFFGTNLSNINKCTSKINNIKFLPSNIKKRLSNELNWRFFIQQRLDRILPYKKYYIRNLKVKNYLINKNDSFYFTFRSCHFKNGKKYIL